LLNILVAEDNPGDVYLVKLALERHRVPHELFVVTDGEKALNFVAEMGKPGKPPCPDLLLLDINLPRVDGPTILSEFRKNPACVNTPVIVMTSSDATKERIHVEALGVDRFFRKPSDLTEFMELGAIERDVVESSA